MTILDLFGEPTKLTSMAQTFSDHPPDPSRQVLQSRRFYLGTPAASARGLMVICGGWERVAPDYVVQRDGFPWTTLEFVAAGRGTLVMAGRQHVLEPGSCFAYGPAEPHRISTDPHDLLSKFYLNFGGRLALNLLSAVSLSPGNHRVLTNPAPITEALHLLIADGALNHPQSPLIVALQLHTLLLKLGGDHLDDNGPDRRARQTLQKCLDHIERTYVETATAEEVALACHVSPGHMSRLFSRYGYRSPYDYLIRRKMQHAAELFDSGRLLVREVADQLGLDPFQFSRVFKRVHGLSPSRFVRRHGIPPTPTKDSPRTNVRARRASGSR